MAATGKHILISMAGLCGALGVAYVAELFLSKKVPAEDLSAYQQGRYVIISIQRFYLDFFLVVTTD